MTRKPWFIALCMLGGIATMIAIGVFAVDGLRKTFLRTIMFTTADPDVLGEVASTSMKPITVTLQANRKETINTDRGQFESVRWWDRSLTITAPAAFFHEISTKEGPAGSQHVGFSVWSKRFDPSQPDAMEWQLARRKGSMVGDVDTNYERRVEGGEHELRFRLVNGVRRPEERQRVLKGLARGDQKAPCEEGFDAELQMVTFGAPAGLKIGERWCKIGNDHNATTYLKLNPDNSALFTVSCDGTGPRGTPIDRSDRPGNTSFYGMGCQMSGYFGSWPIQVFVRYRHRHDWAAQFDRIQQFLTSIATEKLGPRESR